MYLRTFVVVVLALVNQVAFSQSNAVEQELEHLKAQIEQLTQRVEHLEQNKPVATSSSVDSASSTPWHELKVGMPTWKVEKHLGKPTSKKKGGVAYWYYSTDRENGPMIKFVLGNVHSWRAP